MLYEVENKYRVTDQAAVAERLAALGCVFDPAVRQMDRYFNHPVRDFARTDEALRIRSVGEKNQLTYKGPKLDAATKTRREIELPLGDGEFVAEQMAEVLTLLGFRPTAAVIKQRTSGHFTWSGYPVEATLDTLDGLGMFVELEFSADESTLPAAQAALLELAAHLELGEVERRSYLCMVMGKAGGEGGRMKDEG